MLIATRKNRQLRIPDEKKGVYESLGYTITDESGAIISEPENPEKKVAELEAEVEALKAENEKLKEAAGEEEKPKAAGKKTAAKKEAADAE